ncbi:MAG: hypothetical protein IJX63_00195 [Lachnospiraceae bacterium]|nr:hypothetical protein [Lachnospiraceae bacterium]
MEMMLSSGFCEMTQNEMLVVDGGDAGADFLTKLIVAKDVFMLGFNLGRELARDVKEWMSDSGPGAMVVIPEPV